MTGPQPRGGTGADLWEQAKEIIPGGNQLLSKRAELFAPQQWPAYYQRAAGVRVVDLDGNEFVDMSIMGGGPCILGYADEDVDSRVHEVVDQGPMSTLNPPEEVDLARRLLQINPWADMVRFGRMGGETMAMAVRIARAATGNDTVAMCGYHGWHDWYLAANLEGEDALEDHLLPGLDPNGVPRSLRGSSYPFHYNDIEELESIATNQDLAAIVMEPIRNEEQEGGFLNRVRAIANEQEVPLIFDEITSGWRTNVGGAHQELDVLPDVAVYSKAMANGYPIAAVVGKDWVMDAAQETFISSTFWTERIGPAAALATLEKLERENVPDHLVRIGNLVRERLREIGNEHGLEVSVSGLPPLTIFDFDSEGYGQEHHTLFTQEMLEFGYLASNAIYVSYSHTEDVVDEYCSAVDEVFGSIVDAEEANEVAERIYGPVAHEKFERLN